MTQVRTGKSAGTVPEAPTGNATDDLGVDLPLPHERDESTGDIAAQPDPQIQQAKKDLDAGQVDTDMWGTPGLDHARKERLVPKTKPED